MAADVVIYQTVLSILLLVLWWSVILAILTDVNNYRAIAISNSLSKTLETALDSFIGCNDKTDNYQFRFRQNHSTALCFKQTVNYCVQTSSHVFRAFIDFNKAFDNVDYWLLFCDLMNKRIRQIYIFSNACTCLLVQQSENVYSLAGLCLQPILSRKWCATRRHLVAFLISFLCS